jgi:hypothetical protein
MIRYEVQGPTSTGEYLVVYQTPGCDVMTVACRCRTAGQAESARAEMQRERLNQAKAVQAHLRALGQQGHFPELEH